LCSFNGSGLGEFAGEGHAFPTFSFSSRGRRESSFKLPSTPGAQLSMQPERCVEWVKANIVIL
jgi:hypothetical protein